MTRRAPAVDGLGGRIEQARSVQRMIESLSLSNHDDLDRARRKLATAQRVMAQVIEELAAQGMTTRTGVYAGPEVAIDGTPRVKIQLEGLTYKMPLGGGLELSELVVGQVAEISSDGSSVVAVEHQCPEGGEVMTVASVGPESGWLEVEDSAGDRRRRIQLSGFIDASVLREGDGVRVRSDFAYERVAHVKRKSFLDSALWSPDPAQRFDQIRGQDAAVERMRVLVDGICRAEPFPGSALLGNPMLIVTGPPGNGKSLLAAALGNELRDRLGSGVQLYLIRGASVKDKWVGNSEANLRAPLEQATRDFRERGVRSLIVFEEFDSLGAKRGTLDSSGVSQSLVTTLLSYLNGCAPLEGVIILCLTNHPHLIDEALMRPERLGGQARLEMGRVGVDAMCGIVEQLLAKDHTLTDGSALEAFARAARAALGQKYGTARVGKAPVDVLGLHLSTGAAATSGVKAAIILLHTHLSSAARRRIETPYDRLSPAHLYHGLTQTLAAVMRDHAGVENLVRARAMFAGDLVHPAELGALTEVTAIGRAQIPVPEAFDLSSMFELAGARAAE